MEATIDKFGRVLIPQKIRKLLGFLPGQKVLLSADIEAKSLEISLDKPQSKSELVIKESGLPVIKNGPSYKIDFDTVAMVQEDREEYLNRKMGLK